MKRLLIVGTGSIGERHLRCFQATGRAEVAACEPNPELGKAVAAKYGCRRFASLGEALESGPFDAAVVCTPANTHIPIASACVERGLHALIEKPLAVSLEGTGELQRLAEEKRRVIRIAYTYRSIPAILRLREMLGSGRIGEPRHVEVVAGQHFPAFRPAYREIYYAKHELGGGAIQDALTHLLHGVEWLVGPITALFADATRQVLEGVEVEDTVNLVARLGNGAAASFAINQFQAPNETVISIHGTRGSLRAELHRQRVGIFVRGEAADTADAGGAWCWSDLPPEERDGAFIRQAASFLDAIKGRPDTLSTLADGVQSLRVNLAALRSAQTRREIQI